MEPFKPYSEEVLLINPWKNNNPHLVAGFTTSQNGCSSFPKASLNLAFHVSDEKENVVQNRMKLADKIDFPLDQWISTEQIHDVHVATVTQKDRAKGSVSSDDWIPKTDGLITNESGILLTLCFADCVPLYFVDPESKWIGMAHAGWKGTTGNIAGKIISLLEQKGVSPENLQAAIGPSICKTCYIVDYRVIQAVEELLEEEDKKPYNEIEEGQFQLDLRDLNKQLMIKAGMKKENILTTEYCSSCDDLFFSHRRDRGNTGRMLSIMGWREE